MTFLNGQAALFTESITGHEIDEGVAVHVADQGAGAALDGDAGQLREGLRAGSQELAFGGHQRLRARTGDGRLQTSEAGGRGAGHGEGWGRAVWTAAKGRGRGRRFIT